MSSASEQSIQRLTLALQAQGITSARALGEALDVSQPTLSRHLGQLSAAQLERFGSTRSAQYALRRVVRGLGTAWPLYRIDASGRAQAAGELRALHGGYRYLPADPAPSWLLEHYPTGAFSGLPFFLQDIAPQGYVGRAIARHLSNELNLPADPRAWNDDDVLTYLLAQGDDLPGNLILGDRALESALGRMESQSRTAIPVNERLENYAQLADRAARGEQYGSSAGGDQPKFLATLRDQTTLTSVIVKFSAAEASPVSERWADLLLCEHLAAQTLSAYGHAAARTAVFEAAGRRLLEIERFDRTATSGRRGLLTLGALEDALLDTTASDWIAYATALHSAGLLSDEHARELRFRACFGNLIANTDMHRSNTSLFFGHDSDFHLTPSYDMLPMLFAPGSQGELVERTFAPRPPLPAVADVWPEAARAAVAFWSAVATDARISARFAGIASAARDTVRSMSERFG